MVIWLWMILWKFLRIFADFKMQVEYLQIYYVFGMQLHVNVAKIHNISNKFFVYI